MSEVWKSLINLSEYMIREFNSTGEEVFEDGMDRFNQPGWVNRVWKSNDYRRAHLDIVDARETKGLWMMHVCVFPILSSDAPIYGFDVVAGKNKMTGAFHDFSPTVNEDHEMIKYFADKSKALNWKRERELPDWAKQIFTENMIAAGNVNNEEEIWQVNHIASDNLNFYLDMLRNFSGNAPDYLVAQAHNRYAYFQKQNPHTPRTMAALGLDEEDVKVFIEKCLFPEVEVPLAPGEFAKNVAINL